MCHSVFLVVMSLVIAYFLLLQQDPSTMLLLRINFVTVFILDMTELLWAVLLSEDDTQMLQSSSPALSRGVLVTICLHLVSHSIHQSNAETLITN
jgi:hypothetical protein